MRTSQARRRNRAKAGAAREKSVASPTSSPCWLEVKGGENKRGEGGERGRRSGGKPGSHDPYVSRGTPDAVHSTRQHRGGEQVGHGKREECGLALLEGGRAREGGRDLQEVGLTLTLTVGATALPASS